MHSGDLRRLEARRGFSLSYKGKTLLSLVDPEGQADRLVAALSPQDRTLYFCPSPLYGYGLQALLKGLGLGSAVLCVETDETLMEFSREALEPLLAGSSRLRLVRTRDPAVLSAYVRETWGSRTFRRVEPLRLSGGWRLDAGTYEALLTALIQESALDWGNAMTLVRLGRRYARNTLQNLALLPRSRPVGALNFGGRPLLVLGAGPSLDEILPALLRFFGPRAKEGRTRPFGILCADTVLPCLRDWEIRPDLAVALECQHWNLRDFIGLGDWNIPLGMDLSALPVTGRVLGGELFLFATPWTGLSLFDRLEKAALLPELLPPLGSVGLSTVALALRLSSGPVVAAGLDFSFTLDRFHARATPGHRDRLRGQNRLQSLLQPEAAFRRGAGKTVSKEGLPVWTDPALKNYRDLFEREFAGEKRLRDIAGPGLSLGLNTLSLGDALSLLNTGTPPAEAVPLPGGGEGLEGKTRAFIREEREALLRLRAILSGALPAARETLEALLDRSGFLWAHFPECAATEGRRPPATDASFLKRVRVEIDPALEVLGRALEELRGTAGHGEPPEEQAGRGPAL